jgi:hypothetical protein
MDDSTMDLNSDLYTSLLGLDLAFRMILAIPFTFILQLGSLPKHPLCARQPAFYSRGPELLKNYPLLLLLAFTYLPRTRFRSD